MKKLSKIFSAGLSLTLCAALVVPSFAAASFKDLQDSINNKSDYTYEKDGETVTGIGYDKDTDTVTLYEKVEFDAEKDSQNKTISIKGDVTLDLNGHDIDGQNKNGDSVITVVHGGELTLKDETAQWTKDEDGNDVYVSGSITGGTGVDNGGGITNYGELTVKSGAIRENHAKGMGGGVITFMNDDAVFTMEGGVIENNSSDYSGGIGQWHGTLNLLGGVVRNNEAHYGGGGLYINWATVNMDGISIIDNVSGNESGAEGGGGVTLEKCTTTIANTTITGNHSEVKGGGILFDGGGTVTFGTGNKISGNTAVQEGDDIVTCCDGDLDVLGSFGDWLIDSAETRENGEKTAYDFPENGIVPSGTELKAPVPETDEPVVPVPTPGNTTGVTIDDPEVPLAVLFTRADAIGYLWEQEGSPDWELSEFPDVPEDHQWAVAIGWAEDMGIALPDLDGNFRPDEPVLTYVDNHELYPEGELQEFLNRFAEYAGIELDEDELFYLVGGEAYDIVMGEDAQVIFDDFFAKLEAALAQAA